MLLLLLTVSYSQRRHRFLFGQWSWCIWGRRKVWWTRGWSETGRRSSDASCRWWIFKTDLWRLNEYSRFRRAAEVFDPFWYNIDTRLIDNQWVIFRLHERWRWQLYPSTDPSFFPAPGVSSSIPAHTPALNCVVPRNRRVPVSPIWSTRTLCPILLLLGALDGSSGEGIEERGVVSVVRVDDAENRGIRLGESSSSSVEYAEVCECERASRTDLQEAGGGAAAAFGCFIRFLWPGESR